MKVSLINDWEYLFKDWAIGGRFASFTFFNLSYMNLHNNKYSSSLEDDMELVHSINGLSVILLGLGVRIKL